MLKKQTNKSYGFRFIEHPGFAESSQVKNTNHQVQMCELPDKLNTRFCFVKLVFVVVLLNSVERVIVCRQNQFNFSHQLNKCKTLWEAIKFCFPGDREEKWRQYLIAMAANQWHFYPKGWF